MTTRNLFWFSVLTFSLSLVCPSRALRAQAQADAAASTDTPPKVLFITREFVKPGRDGAPHVKTEEAFASVARSYKAGPHYIGMTSLSGAPRALFIEGMPSMEAVEAEHKAMPATVAAAMDRANVADGELLTQMDQSLWLRVDSLSNHSSGWEPGTRYFLIRQFIVKPGHLRDWHELVGMVKSAYAKSVPEAHWSTFQLVYGNSPHNTFLVITLLKSLRESDAMVASDPAFEQALGRDGLKRLGELESQAIDSRIDNIFAISPKMSVPPERISSLEPTYWATKPGAAAAKKSTVAAKPAD